MAKLQFTKSSSFALIFTKTEDEPENDKSTTETSRGSQIRKSNMSKSPTSI